MRRSKEQLAAAAAQSEDWLDALAEDEVATGATGEAGSEDLSDLRRVAQAADEVAAAQARLREAVTVAQARGRSWGRIGMALGTSRQAARQRFAQASLVESSTDQRGHR